MFLVKPKQYGVTYANLVSQPMYLPPLTLKQWDSTKFNISKYPRSINLD